MNIGFIGDLHMDYNVHHDYLKAFTDICQYLSLDKIVFCGDTTTGAFAALDFYEKLSEKVETEVLEIPGNHELYCLGDQDQREMTGFYCMDANDYLDLLLSHPKFSLYTHPIVHNDWVIIGGPSWYDYTLHKKYDLMSEQKKAYFLRKNPEYKYIQDSQNSPHINEAITANSLKILEYQLQTIRHMPGGDQKKICSVIHMLPIAELYHKKPIFNTTIAFMGSRYYGELYDDYHVDLCICAHSHNRMQMKKNETTYVNVSLGHNFKWKNKTNLFAEILDTMYVLKI